MIFKLFILQFFTLEVFFMADFFDFESLTKNEANPFEDSTNYTQTGDDRFYTLSKDKNGSGCAIICFVPDKNQKILKKVFKFNIKNPNSGSNRFLDYYSPSTIGAPDPVQEQWQKLWNAGKKDESREFSRKERFIINIKIIKDPAHPENEGKIFLYDMSSTMKNKIEKACKLSDLDVQLNRPRKEIFNPTKGWLFTLTCSKASNGFTSYDDSEFFKVDPEDPAQAGLIPYKSAQEALDDITGNAYSLDWFEDLNNYMPYDEIKRKLGQIYPELADSNGANTTSETVVVKEKTKIEPDVQDAGTVNASTSTAEKIVQESAKTESNTVTQDARSLIESLVG